VSQEEIKEWVQLSNGKEAIKKYIKGKLWKGRFAKSFELKSISNQREIISKSNITKQLQRLN